MIEGPFAIAFGAGLVATMNPCGFAMLPAYLSYFMGLNEDDDRSRPAAIRRALLIGGVMSVAFLVVFGTFGLLITAGFRAVIDWIPYIALGVGVLIVGLGIAMLFGYELTVALPKAKSAGKDKGIRGVFGFGLSYGVASLSCTLPVFLSVVATQLTAASFVSGVATFIVYGLGMAIMLIGVTIALALGKNTIVNKLRASARYINRIAGAVLVIAGTYIVWFWGTNLSEGAEALNDQGVFRFVETLSQRATELFGENAAIWGVILVAAIAALAIYAFRPKRPAGPEDPSGSAGLTTTRKRLVAGAVSAAILVAAVGGVAALSGSNSSSATAGTSAAAPRGPLAPTASFAMFDGSTATFATYQGKPLVVNFWASWCPSCVAELSAAIRPVQTAVGDQVAFLGVNLQDDRDDALELVQETGIQFDLAEDDGALYQDFGGIGMPFTVFISAAGEVIDKHNGPLTEGQLTDKIQESFLDFTDGPAVVADGPAVVAGATTPSTTTPALTSGGPAVIIEENPALPGAIARLEGWTTNWGKRTIDLNQLQAGIFATDPRDIIPPLDAPEFERVTAASEWLAPREPGVLFRIGDDTRFYPLRILTWHEIANDVVDGRNVVVTFCPLCNTAVVFDPTVNGEVLRFGVSGLLRFSDLVMWDAQTGSLWQQITGEGIVGDLAGTQLELLPSSVVSWEEFANGFPDGKVLSRQTGFSRSYGTNPYEGYSSSSQPFLFEGDADSRYPALERVVGVTVNEEDKAFPFSVLAGERAVNNTVGGLPVAVFWGSDTADALDSSRISEGQAIGTGIAFDRTVDGQVLSFTSNGDDTFTDAQTGSTWDLLGRATAGPLSGEELTTVVHRNDFWFAWAAFHPGDDVYAGVVS